MKYFKTVLLLSVVLLNFNCTPTDNCNCTLQKGRYFVKESFSDYPEYKEFIKDGKQIDKNIGDILYHYKSDIQANQYVIIESDTCFSGCLKLKVSEKYNFKLYE